MNVRASLLILVVITLSQALSACASSLFSPTSTPTAIPTPTKDPLESAKVVQAFWDALAANDLETAMVYVADDVTCAGNCYFKGKGTFRSYLQGYLDAGFTTKISDVRSVGSIVTYSWEAYRRGNFVGSGDGDEVMEVEDGKIVHWENQHQ